MFLFQNVDRDRSVPRGAVKNQPESVFADDVTDVDRSVRDNDGQKTPPVIQRSTELLPCRCLVVGCEAPAELAVRLILDLHEKR